MKTEVTFNSNGIRTVGHVNDSKARQRKVDFRKC